ncbi:hypothetical protein DPEC_G00181700 [Dallia pectoralis]|uniref:Uncharacterized protein n=1 Tax=Dallia pectoralis TaxID=75939 RepID=A0ACC2GA91_DALPE|nr:hypothetical protein DPEC_G00181700 [Dallia pectoralis]
MQTAGSDRVLLFLREHGDAEDELSEVPELPSVAQRDRSTLQALPGTVERQADRGSIPGRVVPQCHTFVCPSASESHQDK